MAKNDLCDICGYDDIIRNVKKYNMKLCDKHRHQLKYYNKILDSRPPKKDYIYNEIIICDNYAKILVYDKYNYEINNFIIDLEDSFKDVEPELYSCCVKECVYRNGLCPEFKSCGFNQTVLFEIELKEYLDGMINQINDKTNIFKNDSYEIALEFYKQNINA